MTDFTIFYFNKILRNDVIKYNRSTFSNCLRAKLFLELKNDVTNKIYTLSSYTFVELLEYQMNANT